MLNGPLFKFIPLMTNAYEPFRLALLKVPVGPPENRGKPEPPPHATSSNNAEQQRIDALIRSLGIFLQAGNT
jgi:hypothetical protein